MNSELDAGDIVRWRAEEVTKDRSTPYPSAVTDHRGRMMEILAPVPAARYGGTPGRIFSPEGDDVAIVTAPTGGYLTGQP